MDVTVPIHQQSHDARVGLSAVSPQAMLLDLARRGKKQALCLDIGSETHACKNPESLPDDAVRQQIVACCGVGLVDRKNRVVALLCGIWLWSCEKAFC